MTKKEKAIEKIKRQPYFEGSILYVVYSSLIQLKLNGL